MHSVRADYKGLAGCLHPAAETRSPTHLNEAELFTLAFAQDVRGFELWLLLMASLTQSPRQEAMLEGNASSAKVVDMRGHLSRRSVWLVVDNPVQTDFLHRILEPAYGGFSQRPSNKTVADQFARLWTEHDVAFELFGQ
jgi:hypothetical protein